MAEGPSPFIDALVRDEQPEVQGARGSYANTRAVLYPL
jgi:hypothetical protein